MPITFNVEELKTVMGLERVLRRFERALDERPATVAAPVATPMQQIVVGDGGDVEEVIRSIVAPIVRDEVQAAGSAPLNPVALPTVAGLKAGTYTPEVTALTNLDSATASAPFRFHRVGKLLVGSGRCTVDPTADAVFTFRISLPVSAAFSDAEDATGLASGFDAATSNIPLTGYANADVVTTFSEITFICAANGVTSSAFISTIFMCEVG